MKKTLIVVFIFLTVFGIVLMGVYLHEDNEKQFQKVSVGDVVSAIEENKSMIVYYGQEECSACNAFEKNLLDICEHNEKDIMYLDADSLEKEDEKILLEYHVTTTPTLIIVNNGKTFFYRDITAVEEIEKAIMNVDIVEDRFDGLVDIDYSELEQKIEKQVDFFLYIGREDCRDCVKFNPILTKCIEEKKGQGMYYLDIKKYRDLANNENAQKEDVDFYDEMKKKYDIKWVPSLYHFRNGMIIAKYEFLDEAYYKLSQELQEKEERYYIEELYDWMEIEFQQ